MPNFPSIAPSYSLIKIPVFQTNVISYGNKIEQRLAKNSEVQWKFQLNFNVLTKTDADAIMDFFIARRGRLESFTWLNPEDSLYYTVRFEEDALNIDYFAYLLYSLKQINFIEVTELGLNGTQNQINFIEVT